MIERTPAFERIRSYTSAIRLSAGGIVEAQNAFFLERIDQHLQVFQLEIGTGGSNAFRVVFGGIGGAVSCLIFDE